jgi:uncharacterized membrane protein (UPF0127 family)
MNAHFLQPYLRNPDDAWAVRNQSTGAVLATSIVAAFDRETRNRGLLGHRSFPRGVALVLAPCSAIHTWFMRFPVDVIFVSRAGQVLRVRQAVAPFRLALRVGAFAAIELAGGSSAGTSAGDILVLTAPIPQLSSCL